VRGALDVHQELLARAVPHEVVRLRSRVLTADDLPRVMGLEQGCVTVRCYLVERDGGSSFAAVLVPAGTVPVPSRLLEALDACSVRPARPDQVNAVTDYAAGLVCPVGLSSQVELLVDRVVERTGTCYCALGEGGVALGIRTRDLLEATGARVAPLSEPADDREDADADAPRVIDLDRTSLDRTGRPPA
jgi:Cys-tRNA(Pro)/Cys-tRNA(Cys) deacylase